MSGKTEEKKLIDASNRMISDYYKNKSAKSQQEVVTKMGLVLPHLHTYENKFDGEVSEELKSAITKIELIATA